jgi:recombination associated protein RdgC
MARSRVPKAGLLRHTSAPPRDRPRGRSALPPIRDQVPDVFRNITLFQLTANAIPSHAELTAALEGARLRSPGPLELSTDGFVSPYGRNQDVLSHGQGPHTLVTFGTESRLLPSQVVNEALAEKLDQIEAQRGRRPGGKERARIKDEVLTELMPRAFIRPGRTHAWLDHGSGWLAIDSASRKAAEAVVHGLREALGSFPATPVAAQTSARLVLTGWLTGDALPEDFTLGDECELRDPGDDGAIVRCRRQDLGAEEIREHINAGKQVAQLAVSYQDRLLFVLGEDLTLRKLRFGDVVLEELGDGQGDDALAELNARFALLTGEMARLQRRLADLFALG